MKKIMNLLILALLCASLAAAGNVIVKNGQLTISENATASYFFGDGSQLTGISGGGNCSVDNSCSLITYESDSVNCNRLDGNTSDLCTLTDTDTNESTRFNVLVGTDCTGTDKAIGIGNDGTISCSSDTDTNTNCSVDNSCPLITYESDNIACTRLDGNTSDLCTLTDTDTNTNCSASGNCAAVYQGADQVLDHSGFSYTNITDEPWLADGQESSLDVNSSLTSYDLENFNTTTLAEDDDGYITVVLSWLQGLFLELTDSFGGDVTGTYNALSVNDNSHLHNAANITTGTFGSGEYIFPDNISAENYTVGGNGGGIIYWNGSHTIIT